MYAPIEDRRKVRQVRGREKPLHVDPAAYVRAALGSLAGSVGAPAGAVRVMGRITGVRSVGSVLFADLSDGKSSFQLIVQDGKRPVRRLFRRIVDPGDLVEVFGEVVSTRPGAAAVRLDDFSLVAKHLATFPKRLKDLAKRHENRYLDLFLNPASRRVVETAAEVSREVRRFLWDEGFSEIRSPVLSTSFNGGLSTPFETEIRTLRKPGFLRVTSEIYLKQLIAAGFDSVFEIGSQFRNEGMDSLHLPEFLMLEMYRAHCDADAMLATVLELLERVLTGALGSPVLKTPGGELFFRAGAWKRVNARDAVLESAGVDIASAGTEALRNGLAAAGLTCREEASRGAMIGKLIDGLVRSRCGEPTIVSGLPSGMTPLMRKSPRIPEFADRYWLFAGHVDFCDIGSEQSDYWEQKAALEQQRKGLRDRDGLLRDESILKVAAFGLPPIGGAGLSLSRLNMLVAGVDDIRETATFPLR